MLLDFFYHMNLHAFIERWRQEDQVPGTHLVRVGRHFRSAGEVGGCVLRRTFHHHKVGSPMRGGRGGQDV